MTVRVLAANRDAGRRQISWTRALPHPLIERVRALLGYELDWYFVNNSDGVPGVAWRWTR